MKMCFLFSGIFWGSFLVLIGAAIILKAVFHVDIPILRLFFAFLFIYIGVKILLGSVCRRPLPNCALFGEQKMRAGGGERDFSTVFGKGTLDLTDIVLGDETVEVQGNAVFGSLHVRIKSSIPTIIESSAVFGDVRTPEGDSLSFGSRSYRNGAYQADKPHVRLKISAVFGNILVSQE